MITNKFSTKLVVVLMLLMLLTMGLVGCESIEAGAVITKSTGETSKPIDRTDDSDQGLIATDTGLTAYLELTEDRLATGEKINLNFILTNVSDAPLYILTWYTPLEGIAGEIFRVTHDGQLVPYEGILASRSSPSPEEYVLLNSGESVSAVVDLAAAFDFSKAGMYTIEFISPRISHVARTEAELANSMDDLGTVHIPSNKVTLEIVDH